MAHISLITIPREAVKWRFLRPYELHRTLWKGFKGLKEGEQEKRFLYRHNEEESHHSILLQSVTEPDWSFLANESEGVLASTRPYHPEKIPLQQPLRFMLRANPVVSRKYPDGRSRRIVIGSDRKRMKELMGVSTLEEVPTREELLTTWLRNQGDRGGFRLEEVSEGRSSRTLCDVGPNRDIILRKPQQRESKERITITTVDFTGILSVTDPKLFADTIRHGIGRARGFGCGLLSVARV